MLAPGIIAPPQDTFTADLRVRDLSKETMRFLLTWLDDGAEVTTVFTYHIHRGFTIEFSNQEGHDTNRILAQLASFRLFQFDPDLIAQPCRLEPTPELNEDGSNLAVVLDGLRDSHPERFDALNQELGRWLPEFDRILFETPSTGVRAFLPIRTRVGRHPIRATHLSQGTLIALAFLTIAYLPQPPAIVCFEEPERQAFIHVCSVRSRMRCTGWHIQTTMAKVVLPFRLLRLLTLLISSISTVIILRR